jgi:5'-nucleotidase / UDP-sugar diphosphatase
MVHQGGEWVPIDPATVYGVVSNDFMRAGGDGFSMMRDRGMNAYDFGPDLADVLVDYMVANQPYMPALDGRITRR